MYTCIICSKEGLMKMAENVQGFKYNAFPGENICYCFQIDEKSNRFLYQNYLKE